METETWEIESCDYNFLSVPEEEVEACVYYEYARESASIIRDIAEIQKFKNKLKLKESYNKESGKILYKGSYDNLKKTLDHQVPFGENLFVCDARNVRNLKFFPKKTWLNLDSKEKESARFFLDAAHNMVTARWPNRPPIEFQDLDYNWEHGANQNVLSCRINLDCSIREIKEVFESEVVRIFTELTHKRRGKDFGETALAELAALRTRFVMEIFDDARDEYLKYRKPNMPVYRDRKSFNRASRAALNKMHIMFGLDKIESPIHWKSRWQKGW